MADSKILPYLDIPFQHASPRVLKLMKRPGAVDKTLERIQRWRSVAPDITIRSTFIVGFPGETEAEFEELLDFLDERSEEHTSELQSLMRIANADFCLKKKQ